MDKVTIKIPRTLYEKIQVIVEESGFSSPTEFVVFVLRDLVGDRLQKSANPAAAQSGQLTSDEVEVIRKRLKSLGYL